MKFLLSWLADYVDLGDGFPLLGEPTGRHAFSALDADLRRAGAALAARLTALGLAVEAIVELERDQGGPDLVLDVDVTSNRPDAMCHVGLARELAVAAARPLSAPVAPTFATVATDGTSAPILIEDGEACPRYVARVVRGIAIGPSPAWLRRRLEAIGLRPIHNVVDATNYVLWELGQPLHAFDLATIPGGEVRVRRAFPGERLVTLDGRERLLDPEMLVIADRARAIALAGILGGRDTEVTPATTDILLESAHFDRRRVRIAARKLGLHTDASHRFERGADFGLCDEASRRCAALIVEVAGGEVVEPAIDAVTRSPRPVRWQLDRARLARFLGFEVVPREIVSILSSLGFEPESADGHEFAGRVPTYRLVDFAPRPERSDSSGRAEPAEAYPQDVYEELLRHVGFARVPATLPALGGADAGASPAHERAGRARDLLASVGFVETVQFAFHDRAWDARFPAIATSGEPLELANPLSERYAILRRSLVPNLIATAEFNAHRGASGVRLFEIGHLFPGRELDEFEAVGLVSGGRCGTDWDRQLEADAFALKGVCERLCSELGAPPVTLVAAALPGIVAGTGALWHDPRGGRLGWSGRIEGGELPFPLFAAELALDSFAAATAPRPVRAPPRLPGISADLTLTHSTELFWSELVGELDRDRPALLVGFRLKDRYQGPEIPPGAVATTLTLDYHGGERSLTQDEVNACHAVLVERLERRYAVARQESR